MVEDLIAEGLTPDQIVEFVMTNLHLSESEAELYVNTALGGSGDVIVEDVGEAVVDGSDWKWNDAVVAASEPDVKTLAMVAVYPRADEQEALALEGGQDAEGMHVTLVFLGEVDSFDHDQAREAIARAATMHEPLAGKVGGIGYFAAGENGTPVIALPSVRGLAELRASIDRELALVGIVSPTEHGWTPHLTLAYQDEPSVLEVPDVPLSFDAVSFVVADEREDFPLTPTE